MVPGSKRDSTEDPLVYVGLMHVKRDVVGETYSRWCEKGKKTPFSTLSPFAKHEVALLPVIHWVLLTNRTSNRKCPEKKLPDFIRFSVSGSPTRKKTDSFQPLMGILKMARLGAQNGKSGRPGRLKAKFCKKGTFLDDDGGNF
ncbi:hypothetical protein AVEN_226746-1 [Araneus ventricosus]|uniref:Uncharacterized protein n=1 Tax=Araneus ventricosus TaxID=182803 RepID=A0A4Y2GGA6_ARAVE|nr:hypothetical protein AVEN_226746-1 [Araneus ventricosus]